MMWEDVVLERLVSVRDLIIALESAFSVAEGEVAVIESVEDLIGMNPVTHVVFETWTVQGEFAMVVSIMWSGRQMYKEVPDVITTVKKLCKILTMKALVSDESINPYTNYLISDSGLVELIGLDPVALDSSDEYIVKFHYDTKSS